METITAIEVNNRNVPGLMDLIREALTEEEIKKLVATGKSGYANASPKTIRKWDRLAEQRIKELNTPEVQAPVVTEKKKSVKK